MKHEEAVEQVEWTDAQRATFADLYLGDGRHWPCPFCPRATARRAMFSRKVHVAPDGEERPYSDNVSLATDFGKLIFPEMSMLLSFAGAAMSEKELVVEVYECAEHGEFFVVLDDSASSAVVVRRTGKLERANTRFAFCPAVIERADAKTLRRASTPASS